MTLNSHSFLYSNTFPPELPQVTSFAPLSFRTSQVCLTNQSLANLHQGWHHWKLSFSSNSHFAETQPEAASVHVTDLTYDTKWRP